MCVCVEEKILTDARRGRERARKEEEKKIQIHDKSITDTAEKVFYYCYYYLFGFFLTKMAIIYHTYIDRHARTHAHAPLTLRVRLAAE